jgi:hypothetical protein
MAETGLPGRLTKEVNFKDFINHKVLVINGQPYSVRDVIKFASDVAGGVHHTSNPKERQKLVADYSAHFGIGGLPGGIRQLKAIARVTLKGLRPLIEAAEKK